METKSITGEEDSAGGFAEVGGLSMKREYDFSAAKRAKNVGHLVRIRAAVAGEKVPLNEKELLERDAKRDIGAELLQSVQEMMRGAGVVKSKLPICPDAQKRL